MLKSRNVRIAPAIVVSVFVLAGGHLGSADAATRRQRKPASTKTKKTTKATVTTVRVTTAPATSVPTNATAAALTPNAQVLVGYEAYLTAFVAAAREPGRAAALLPQGMTGDALTRMLDIRGQEAREGVFWDGTRKDIISGPTIEKVGDTTATLRDCRSVGGVLRQKASGEVVAGSTEPDVDDFRVTLVRFDGKWVVTATDRFNDVEGRSRCQPGAPPS